METPEDWHRSHCRTFRDDGVFLPPPPEDDPYLPSCPASPEYGASGHVYRDDGDQDRGAVTEGSGDDRRLVTSHPANRWHSVAFVERGVRLEFNEIDQATYEAIVASEEGGRASLPVIDAVSGHRIRAEWDVVCASPARCVGPTTALPT